jgi:hypothetical protein
MDHGRAMQKRAPSAGKGLLTFEGEDHRRESCGARGMRRFLFSLILIAVLFGSPYAAWLLNRVMGPWSAGLGHQDGSVSQIHFDPTMPPADFVPVFPGALIVQSSRLVSRDAPSGVGFLELAVQGTTREVRNFYRTRLEAAGFTVDDLGTPGLNAAAAALVGTDGTMVGKRPATDDVLVVQISTEEGVLVRSRLLQLQWRKLSEWPASQPKP